MKNRKKNIQLFFPLDAGPTTGVALVDFQNNFFFFRFVLRAGSIRMDLVYCDSFFAFTYCIH